MKLFSKKSNTRAVRSSNKYDAPATDNRAQSTVVSALVESVLNPFFVLGRR